MGFIIQYFIIRILYKLWACNALHTSQRKHFKNGCICNLEHLITLDLEHTFKRVVEWSLPGLSAVCVCQNLIQNSSTKYLCTCELIITRLHRKCSKCRRNIIVDTSGSAPRSTSIQMILVWLAFTLFHSFPTHYLHLQFCWHARKYVCRCLCACVYARSFLLAHASHCIQCTSFHYSNRR